MERDEKFCVSTATLEGSNVGSGSNTTSGWVDWEISSSRDSKSLAEFMFDCGARVCAFLPRFLVFTSIKLASVGVTWKSAGSLQARHSNP